MKFTSEDLLKAMGLKVGDKFKTGILIYEVVINDNQAIVRRLLNNGEYVLYSIGDFLDSDYTIIQPKPTLTEDEKVILRNLPKYIVNIYRDKSQNLYIGSDDGSYTRFYYHNMFDFIKFENGGYSIKELLKED